MKYFIQTRNKKEAFEFKALLTNKLNDLGYLEDEKNPDFVFSVGGDGTFLKLIHQYINKDVIFVPINMGHVGFMCEFATNELLSSINNLNNYQIRLVPLIETKINDKLIYSLNEIRIESNNGTSIKFDICVDDIFLETIRADGICISSSYGSSGLNRSMNGALVDHELNVLEVVEKNAINNKLYSSLKSPLILNGQRTVGLKNFSYEHFSLFYDTKYEQINHFKGDISIKLSEKKIKVLTDNNYNYIDRIREGLIG